MTADAPERASRFIGGALLGGASTGWVSPRIGWPLAAFTISGTELRLRPTVRLLFRERVVARTEIEFISYTRVRTLTRRGLLVQSAALVDDGFAFWPLPFDGRQLIAALEYWNYEVT